MWIIDMHWLAFIRLHRDSFSYEEPWMEYKHTSESIECEVSAWYTHLPLNANE